MFFCDAGIILFGEASRRRTCFSQCGEGGRHVARLTGSYFLAGPGLADGVILFLAGPGPAKGVMFFLGGGGARGTESYFPADR